MNKKDKSMKIVPKVLNWLCGIASFLIIVFIYFLNISSEVEFVNYFKAAPFSIYSLALCSFIFMEPIYFAIKNMFFKQFPIKNLVKLLLIAFAILLSGIFMLMVHSLGDDSVKWCNIIFTTIAAICNTTNLLYIDKDN